MTSHEERARDWMEKPERASTHEGDVAMLAAEFAAVEAEAQKRVAVLEAALKGVLRGNPTISDWDTADAAMSGEPTALLALLERAVEAGRKAGMHDQQFVTGGYGRTEPDEPDADIAKRVWEGR